MNRVQIIPFPEIENAYLIISGVWRDKDREFVKPLMTFLYDGGRFAAEWEPKYGPIQIWEKADELTEGTEEHYFYPFIKDVGLNWSQLAVNEEELPSKFVAGEYQGIFDSLRSWAER